jgi:hypothetical protein
LIKFRKIHKFLKQHETTKIDKSIDIKNLKNNVLKITYFDADINNETKDLVLIINPTNEVFYYSNGNKTITLVAGDGGYSKKARLQMKTLMVTPNSFDLFYEEDEK